MTCWEYKVESHCGRMSEDMLNAYGADGWLLCYLDTTDDYHVTYIFARPKAGDEPYPPPGAGALTADGAPAEQAQPTEVGHCRDLN